MPSLSPRAFLDFPPAHSHAARIMAALLLISLLLPAAAATVEICHTGYVMDLYCINRGTLLDNPSVATLVGPQEHSIHCLVDPSICYNSGFALLDAAGPGVAIATPFCAAYVLDGPGNSQALALARATGDPARGCTTCTGGGTLHRGFQATVIGMVDPTAPLPRAIAVTQVLPASTTCAAAGVSSETLANSASLANCNGTITDVGASPAVYHGSLMLLSWGFLLPLGATVARFMKHTDPLWFKLHRGLQMSGLFLAFIGFVIALANFNVFSGGASKAGIAHGSAGIVIMTIGLLQPINACLRPHKESGATVRSPSRRAWERFHKGGGYLALLLAIPTILLGTTFVPPEQGLGFRVGIGVSYSLVAFFALNARLSAPSREIAEGAAAKPSAVLENC